MAKIIKTEIGGKYVASSSLQKLKTAFEDELLYFGTSSVYSEVRKKIFSVDFETLRRMAERLSIVSMIVNCREQQSLPFFFPATELSQPGFVIFKKGKFDKKFKQKDKRAMELAEMISNTGFVDDSVREDNFLDFAQMLVREVLTIDQVAVELQRNKRGEVGAFWLVDGATISRCTEKGYEDNPELAFVQEVRGQVLASYTRDEMIVDYMFKRADMRYRGYGYALLEQAIDLVSTLIMGITYNRDIFTKDKIPKGFIALQGEVDRESIEAVERYWYMAMSGAGARFNIPIIPSGKEGVSMDFKNLGQTNRDLEYHKLMLFFLSLFGAVFGIDLAELGIKTDTSQQLLGEQIAKRQEYSKDRGLKSLLSFIQSVMNRILNKIDPEYSFLFLGVNPEDEQKKFEVFGKALATTKTINELRNIDGDKPLEGNQYDMVLNPTLVQAMQMQGGGEEGEYAEGEYAGEEGGEIEQEIENEEPAEKKESAEEIEKSLNEHLENLEEQDYDYKSLL